MRDRLSFLSDCFYLLTVLFLPTQLGKHFWPSFASVAGMQLDYLSPTLYLTDIFLLFLALTALLQFFHMKQKRRFYANVIGFLSSHLFITAAIFSLLFGMFLSERPIVSALSGLRVGEIIFFAWSTKRFLQKRKGNKKAVAGVFVLTLLSEALLGVAQFFVQGSLGGVLYWFGERSFSIQTPGIANASLQGLLLLRPYGTFSHPNVLSGFLLIGMLFVSGFLLTQKRLGKQYPVFFLALCFSSICLLLTLSRTTIILFFVLLLLFVWFRLVKKSAQNKKYIFWPFLSIVLTISFLIPLLFARFQAADFFGESYELRKTSYAIALQMLYDNPLFGVGSNHFIVALPAYLPSISFPLLQPVHNVFLLLASETGLLGLLGFFEVLFMAFVRNKRKSFLPSLLLASLLFLGMSDHYLFTQQQGRLLMGFVFGVVWASNIWLPLEKKYSKKLI